jgi:hypothetical protein
MTHGSAVHWGEVQEAAAATEPRIRPTRMESYAEVRGSA